MRQGKPSSATSDQWSRAGGHRFGAVPSFQSHVDSLRTLVAHDLLQAELGLAGIELQPVDVAIAQDEVDIDGLCGAHRRTEMDCRTGLNDPAW